MYEWQGACLDTSAKNTLIGLQQAKKYFKHSGIMFKPLKSNLRFGFGTDHRNAVGYIPICRPIRSIEMAIRKVDIVDLSIALLIGLDVLINRKNENIARTELRYCEILFCQNTICACYHIPVSDICCWRQSSIHSNPGTIEALCILITAPWTKVGWHMIADATQMPLWIS